MVPLTNGIEAEDYTDVFVPAPRSSSRYHLMTTSRSTLYAV